MWHRWLNVTTFILIGLVAGVTIGGLVHAFVDSSATRADVAYYFNLLSLIFLRLIKMIIAPLVFSILTSGVAKMGSGAEIGRIGAKTLLWFIVASLCSLLLGLLLVNILQPGVAMQSAAAALGQNATTDSLGSTSTISLQTTIEHAIPVSIVDAMARNEILQILVFSVLFGLAVGVVGEPARSLLAFLDSLSLAMLTVTRYVMNAAPMGVFGAVTATIAVSGLGIVSSFGVFVLEFYLAILLLWCLLAVAGFAVLRLRVFRLLLLIKSPCLLAFSTASSEAAYPKTVVQLTNFGVSEKISAFVLPLGYSFNLDGSMMYCTFATMALAQAYQVHIDFGQQVLMLMLLMIASKGMAGVPRASLLVIQATLGYFHVPDVAIVLLLGIDHFLDVRARRLHSASKRSTKNTNPTHSLTPYVLSHLMFGHCLLDGKVRNERCRKQYRGRSHRQVRR